MSPVALARLSSCTQYRTNARADAASRPVGSASGVAAEGLAEGVADGATDADDSDKGFGASLEHPVSTSATAPRRRPVANHVGAARHLLLAT